ncbi:MAG TPA: type II CAAX endopeptidase family protein, partial [Gemmataceae bacterium]|nr:type II CAAX endopeptidase family protein [Gemmataceae bacterium]
HVKARSSDIVPALQPIDRADGTVTTPSAVPPLPDEPLVSYPPIARPPGKPQPGFFWSLLLCVGFMVITQVPGAVIAAGIMVVMAMADRSRFASQAALFESDAFSLALMPAMLITELLVIGVSWLALRLLLGKSWPRLVALDRPNLSQFLLVLLAFPGLALLGDGSYELLKRFLPSMGDVLSFLFRMPPEGVSTMEEMTRIFNKWPWGFAVLVIGLGPGIGEELWCRAFLGRGLVGRYGLIAGVALTSFFFGLIHVDPRQGTMAMLMGLVLHYVYLTTRSLLMPMLLHFLNNSLAVVASRIPVVADMDRAPDQVSYWLYAAGALLLFAVGWALYKGRARLVGTEESSWQPPFPSVEYPPPGSGVAVVRPHPGWPALAGVLAALLAFIAVFIYAARQIPSTS